MSQDKRADLLAKLDEWEKVAEAATPGPWRRKSGTHSNVVIALDDPSGNWIGVSGTRLDCGPLPVLTGQTANVLRQEWEGNAAFVAQSRTLVPLLLRAVRGEVEAHVHTTQVTGVPYKRCTCSYSGYEWCPTITRLHAALCGGGG